MTFEDYKPIPGVDWATNGARPDDPQRHDRARRVRLRRPAVRDHPAEEERPVRQPADRSDPARGRAEVLRRLLQHAERAQPRAHDQRLLDGAVRRRVGITDVKTYGPYRMPKKLYQYGLNDIGQQGKPTGNGCPASTTVVGRAHRDADDRGRRLGRSSTSVTSITVRRGHADGHQDGHGDPGRDAHHGQRADHGRQRRDRAGLRRTPTSTPTRPRCGTRTRAARPPTAARRSTCSSTPATTRRRCGRSSAR